MVASHLVHAAGGALHRAPALMVAWVWLATAGTCTTFTRANNTFGDNSKSNTDPATAGADAHYGLQKTWDYYLTTFGRTASTGRARRPTLESTTATATRTPSGATTASA